MLRLYFDQLSVKQWRKYCDVFKLLFEVVLVSFVGFSP